VTAEEQIRAFIERIWTVLDYDHEITLSLEDFKRLRDGLLHFGSVNTTISGSYTFVNVYVGSERITRIVVDNGSRELWVG
jgi:hypothetical protein